MVWNKTPDTIVNEILCALEDDTLRYKDIASKFGVSEWLVSKICSERCSDELKKRRYSKSCSVGKTGSKNHMHGKTKLKHPRSKEVILVNGYRTVFMPDWWVGTDVKSNRMYEHHFVWATAYNQVELPKGYVIHHIDHNKHNNSLDNLVLLSISDHMKLHMEIRKVQRLSRKGVGDSITEAHDNSSS